ncbi:hypothetical protein ABRP17_004245 [Stenotrophomonas sp. WHRI 8082]|uniref:hypothetical protein n=1 Tax=Stenotrophomonas sp. WHRI 8082 TaxID=3162571 RepID=UPI0035584192
MILSTTCPGACVIQRAPDEGRSPGLLQFGAALRGVSNTVVPLGRAVMGALDALAPGRLLRTAATWWAIGAALTRVCRAEGGVQPLHLDAVGSDPAVLYTSLQPALAACISELGAGSHEASFVVAHCLTAAAAAACADGGIPGCVSVIERSVQRDSAGACAVAAEEIRVDCMPARRHLLRDTRQSDTYLNAMNALERVVVQLRGVDAPAPSAAYTADDLHALFEGDMSVEDPLEPVGVQGKLIHAALSGQLMHLYQLHPQHMDTACRGQIGRWLDEAWPRPRHQGERHADLSDKQITGVLQELARFLNRKHGLG